MCFRCKHSCQTLKIEKYRTLRRNIEGGELLLYVPLVKSKNAKEKGKNSLLK